jgi:hypothetical protein
MGAVAQIKDLDSVAAGHANTSTEKPAHFVCVVRRMGWFFAGLRPQARPEANRRKAAALRPSEKGTGGNQ